MDRSTKPVVERDSINKDDLLHARVDQQAELICILKQRADEYLEKYMQHEINVVILKEECEKYSKFYSEEQETSNLLKVRLDEIENSNHKLNEMKNYMLEQNESFKNECSRLAEKDYHMESVTFIEKNSIIKHLNAELQSQNEQISSLKERRRSREENLNQQIESLTSEIQTMKLTWNEETNRLNTDIERVNNELEDTKHKLFVSHEEQKQGCKVIIQLQNELQTIKEKLSKDKTNSLSEQKNAELEKRNVKMSYKKAGDKSAVQMKELEEEHNDLVSRFSAYKKHADELLWKEREMNAKLRHLNNATTISMDRNSTSPTWE